MKKQFHFDNTYVKLRGELYSHILPTPVKAPELLIYNEALAKELGVLEGADSPELAELLSGNLLPEDSEPIAQAYCGHQFGYLNELGDGRAILLGEHVSEGGQRVDIQLKGSGKTPYSRNGDGRANVGPMLREYLISEAMRKLGIPSTGSLAVVKTGETVYRSAPLDGAILTRTASSHIRVGTFQFAALQKDDALLRELADYTIRRHYPELEREANPYLSLFQAILDKQIALITDWMRVGFVHGVLNTDNVSIAGETIDYGPCAFMDAYNTGTVFSSIDMYGRYAYGNQPTITGWNMARLAEAFIPLLVGSKNGQAGSERILQNDDEALAVLNEKLRGFMSAYDEAYLVMMAKKLGFERFEEGDEDMLKVLLNLMQLFGFDYTNTFVYLRSLIKPLNIDAELLLPEDDEARRLFALWAENWKETLQTGVGDLEEARLRMEASNPILIPRNLLVDEAIRQAEAGDLSRFKTLLSKLEQPYRYELADPAYMIPPLQERPFVTYCGT